MALQPRHESVLEAAMQSLVGIPIGFVVTYAVERLHLQPVASAATITGLMFALSTLRGFIIRRRFEQRRAACIRE